MGAAFQVIGCELPRQAVLRRAARMRCEVIRWRERGGRRSGTRLNTHHDLMAVE